MRTGLQKGVIILPSAFTLANLYFGMSAMVAAARGEYLAAAWFIVIAAVLDTLDGRIARFTRTGSRFGAELDSLVDAISFGVAPALLVYHLYFADAAWSWLVCFIYVVAVVTRLARFNVEQGGEAKRYFHGLPSPTAGMLVATLHPFSQTSVYPAIMGAVPAAQVAGILMVLLAMLMLSHVPYPLVPRIGFRSARGIGATAFIAACTWGAITFPRQFIFSFLFLYTAWGLVRTVILGLLERLPEQDPLMDDEQDDGNQEHRSLDYGELHAERSYPGGRSSEPPPETPLITPSPEDPR